MEKIEKTKLLKKIFIGSLILGGIACVFIFLFSINNKPKKENTIGPLSGFYSERLHILQDKYGICYSLIHQHFETSEDQFSFSYIDCHKAPVDRMIDKSISKEGVFYKVHPSRKTVVYEHIFSREIKNFLRSIEYFIDSGNCFAISGYSQSPHTVIPCEKLKKKKQDEKPFPEL